MDRASGLISFRLLFFATLLSSSVSDSTCVTDDQDWKLIRHGVTTFAVSAANQSCLCAGNVSASGFTGDGSGLDLANNPQLAALRQQVSQQAAQLSDQATQLSDLRSLLTAVVRPGTIFLRGGPAVPDGFLPCDGSLHTIADYTQLYSAIGTTYGGDGVTTFAVPDLRGRAPIGKGAGPGLSTYSLGQTGGTESQTLLVSNLPTHTHTLNFGFESGSQPSLLGNVFGDSDGTFSYAAPPTATMAAMASSSISPAGGNVPFDKRVPFVAINYIIKY
eukprot:TRINITY_DN860_c0_g1_i3.p1 TRINITY_DN860_c0_g1~~TRINITY_DN860_c0_g1_i3.p1  ORF type:complete len:275 (-),score=61.96 TRINITY_DN860_c0_g1_i3:1-825(-)